MLHPIYPYVESSGHNMQRSVVKWALFTFIPRHFQAIPLIELLYSGDKQGHARE